MRVKFGAVVLMVFALAACRNTSNPPRDNDRTAASPAATTPAESSAGASAKVMMVGCVQEAGTIATSPGEKTGTKPAGTTGTTQAEMPDTKYMLTYAYPTTGNEPVGTSGSPSAARLGNNYRLEGQDDQIAREVGHQVQVTAVEEMPPTGSPASVVPKLKIQEIKMVAAECPIVPAAKPPAR